MTRPAPALGPALLLYAAGRLGLVVLLAGVLVLAGVPLLLAVLIGIIAALPLAAVVLRAPRARLDAALGRTRARRSATRQDLRSRLRGDDERPAGRVADGGGDAVPRGDLLADADDPTGPAPSRPDPVTGSAGPASGGGSAPGQSEPDGREHGPGQ